MDGLQALWAYQAAENDLEELEKSLKNTSTRKRLVHEQEVFKNNQAHLRHLEQESVLSQNALIEVSAQIEALRRQMKEKDIEIEEIEGYDLDDLFPEDVHEMLKECETIRNALETNRRKVSELMRQLESAQNDAQETLVRMSRAKKAFDQLKARHAAELEAGKGDLDRCRQVVTAAAKKVPEPLLAQYRKIKQHRTNPVVHLRSRRCEGCNMEVPSGALQEIRHADHVVVCENCGRILIYVEESSS